MKERDTLREKVVDYATLLFGIAIVVIQIIEYVKGQIEGSTVEVGTFIVGLLLMVRPTILVDIVKAFSGKFTK